MALKQFKAESKRLLDLMINSIYTHREIFLRELISNASDALDKLYFQSLTQGGLGLSRDDLKIHISVDPEARTLTIEDNGIGMTKDELEKNLGTIAQSGSLAFKKEHEKNEEIDVIGQFGVGFYSAFMVSDQVTVHSRAFGSEEAWKWTSTGSTGYSIAPDDKPTHGTRIVLNLKPNTEDENYDEFLQKSTISSLVKRFSDYIRYPIQMDMERTRKKEGTEDEYEKYTEVQTLNTMVPLWKKSKNEITEEEYVDFYTANFNDYAKPLSIIHSKTEGSATYSALLFIPSVPPYNINSRDFEKGLKLYANGVLIMDRCEDLLPDYFCFVRGLVDSEDLSLNISREMLQHDRQLKLIEKSIEKRIKNELVKMMRDDREKYEKVWSNFGLQLKYGMDNRMDPSRVLPTELLLYHSSNSDKLTSLAEYKERMKEGQKYIYYACGESIARIDRLPQVEPLKEKGYEVLYMTDQVDSFLMRLIHTFEDIEFRSVLDDELELETEEEKKALQEEIEAHKEMLDAMKESLGESVHSVTLSSSLMSHPAAISTTGGISLEMERILAATPEGAYIKAQRVLELNPNHPLFALLKKLFETNKEKFTLYTDILYKQSLLAEGILPDDPTDFTNKITALMLDDKQSV